MCVCRCWGGGGVGVGVNAYLKNDLESAARKNEKIAVQIKLRRSCG